MQPLSLFVRHAKLRERVCQIGDPLHGGRPKPFPASRYLELLSLQRPKT